MREGRSSEWLLAGSLGLLLFSLVIIAKVQSFHSKPIVSESKFVEVVVEGLVAKPGAYKVEVGTPVSEVLYKAKPKSRANLKDIDLTERIQGPCSLIIKELIEVTVVLEGAVLLPGKVVVPAGTRVCNLRKYASSDADPACFKKRRAVKDGEIFTIPTKP